MVRIASRRPAGSSTWHSGVSDGQRRSVCPGSDRCACWTPRQDTAPDSREGPSAGHPPLLGCSDDTGLSNADLEVIEQRAKAACAVAELPWVAFLETRHGIGGCSFIRCGTSEVGIELYVDLACGETQITGPDPRLDAVLDFIAAASDAFRDLSPRSGGYVRFNRVDMAMKPLSAEFPA